MRRSRFAIAHSEERGSALVAALVTVAVLVGLAGAALTFTVASKSAVETERGEVRAMYLAEAALSEALFEMNVALAKGANMPAAIGSEEDAHVMRQGQYWSTITDNGDDSYTIRATGEVNKGRRVLEAVVESSGGLVFANALFSGNASGDPSYSLDFSGDGAQADEVIGNVYSGGDMGVLDDADVDGIVRAAGGIKGKKGKEGEAQRPPDIAGMKYEEIADYQVADMFAADGEWKSSSLGGTGWQLPESSPAHIFRLNPTDRSMENASTEKEDYYFEDPYEASKSKDQKISISGVAGKPGESGNDKIYFIDGNLWIHNYKTMGFKAHNNSDGQRLTVVVKGNVYFSDDFTTNPHEKDGIAFIALEDETVKDSGNIYFGDPEFGTLERMEAFMYAQNNFYDYNLDAEGSSEVEIIGTMSAGNHIAINRDFEKPDGSVVHSKLTVQYDPRLEDGTIQLPGVPEYGAAGDYVVTVWREVSDVQDDDWEYEEEWGYDEEYEYEDPLK